MQYICDAQCSAHLSYAAIAFRDRHRAKAGNALIESSIALPRWFAFYAFGPDRADPEKADVVSATLARE